MEYLKQVITQLSETVKRMSVSQVIMLVAIVVGSIVGIFTVAGWVGKVTYQPLYTNMEPSEASEVTGYLSEKGIPYQLSAGGTTIEVSEANLYEARLSLASQGLPNSGNVGYSIFDETNLGMTDFLQKLNFRRALEGELARTISALDEVKTARVHIVMPENRLFSEQQKEATASIVLKLRHSGGLSRHQVNAITHLVASSVEGLQPGNITIVDYSGNMLTSNNGGDRLSSMTSSQMELTMAVENSLERKAQSMLDGVLGPGKAIVRVTGELNFEQYSRSSENYDPNMVAIRSEQKTESSDGSSRNNGEKGGDKADSQSEVIVTNYEVSKSVENVTRAIGDIKRISVAVLIDGTYKTIENGEGVSETVYEPRPQDELDRLGALVKNAIGFSQERNDQFEIVNIAFDKTYLNDQRNMLDEQYTREFYYDIGKKVVMVLAAILVLLYVRKKLKKFFTGLGQILPPATGTRTRPAAKMQPGVPPIEEIEELPEINMDQRRPKLIDQMQKVAKDEPDEIAKVIRTMMVD